MLLIAGETAVPMVLLVATTVAVARRRA